MEALLAFINDEIFPLIPPADGKRPLFNPYAENHPQYDQPDGVAIRRHNLLIYIASLKVLPRVLILGEAPGWRGCRFSGVPFTSEAQLVSAALPFSGQGSSAISRDGLTIRTGLGLLSETSAAIFWDVLRPYHPHFFAWNCIPFHPHLPGSPLSNRSPSSAEATRYLFLLEKLVCCLQPVSIIAIGQKAGHALTSLGLECTLVRHPAHGGANKFRAAFSEDGIRWDG